MLLFAALFCLALGELAPVTNLPGFGPPPSRTIAGRVPVGNKGDELFVYHAEAETNPEDAPTVLWLQGGPGCASSFGFFVEWGSPRMDGNGNFNVNPWSWTRLANMLWIDSPPGTGYSTANGTAGLDGNERLIASNLYDALQAFFAYNNGVYRRTTDFVVSGESFAGAYVPYLAATILNATVGPNDYKIPLTGLMMGNSWVHPPLQMKSYVPFLQYNNLCSEEDAQWAIAQYPQYDALIAAGKFVEAANIDNNILDRLTSDAGINDPYNIRDSTDPTNGPTAALSTWLSSAEVQEALNVPNSGNYVFCANAPYNALARSEEQASLPQLRYVLNQGVRTVLYNGDLDLICDWIGTANYTDDALNYKYQSEFEAAPTNSWQNAQGVEGGSVKVGPLLARVVVSSAGHMVPFDKPVSAFTVFNNTLNWAW